MGLFSGLTTALSIANPVSLVANAAELAGPIASYFGQQQTNQANASNVAATNAANAAAAGATNATQLQIASQNDQMQRDFAQNGISWRIADAARNGISPLAALGAGEPSASPAMPVLTTPVSQASPYSSPLSAASAGLPDFSQNLSRALSTMQSPQQKANDALDLSYKAKQNDLLDIQIANAKLSLVKASQSPGIPSPEPAYQWVRNADGTMSRAPTYNTHSAFMGPALWSLDNQLIPSLGDMINMDPTSSARKKYPLLKSE